MKRITWFVIVLIAITSMSGCARAKRIANDVNWIVFDGEPSREN